jgi:hypothetical protein
MVVDRIRDGGIVVAGQQHHRQPRRRNERTRPLEQGGRHAMAAKVSPASTTMSASAARAAFNTLESPAVLSPPCSRAV